MYAFTGNLERELKNVRCAVMQLYSLYRFERVPRDYFTFRKWKEERILISR